MPACDACRYCTMVLPMLLSSEDISGALAEDYGYVNRSLPDDELDDFVDALDTRISRFDKWAIANTKRLVNANSLPPDVEIAAGWEACMSSIGRPQHRTISALSRFLSPATAAAVGRLGNERSILRPSGRRGVPSRHSRSACCSAEYESLCPRD
jgi:enoyl-CoA hydratase/carnithine racemase